ncbi:hypothetical protein HDU98_010662, partial [Podochytrium sp. JEL0797]
KIAQNCFNSTFASQKNCTTVSSSSSAVSSTLAPPSLSTVAMSSTIAPATASFVTNSAVATSAGVTTAAVTTVSSTVATSDFSGTLSVATTAGSFRYIIDSHIFCHIFCCCNLCWKYLYVNSAAPTSATSTAANVPPNADCLTITQAFPNVQFNIDCYNISPNATYPVGTPTQRRRSSTDYLAFQNGDLIQVNLQNNQLTGAIPTALTQLFATNGVTANFGTNCLDALDNQRSECHKKGINCLAVVLDNGYTGPEYQPLWAALAASGGDFNAFDEVAAAQAYFGYGEYMYQAFKSYASQRISCMLAFPGVPFGTNARRNLLR